MTAWALALLIASSCPDPHTGERMKTMALEAIDTAFRDHIQHLFDIWMRNPSEPPVRAARGMEEVAKAYLHSRAAIENWHPCHTGRPPK